MLSMDPQKLSVRPRKLSLYHEEETDSTFVSCCEMLPQVCSPVRQQDTDNMISCRREFKVYVVLKLRTIPAQGPWYPPSVQNAECLHIVHADDENNGQLSE